MAGVQIGEEGTRGGVEYTPDGTEQWIDHGDGTAEPVSGGGGLGADETSPDHDYRAAGAQVVAERRGVIECPDDVYAGGGPPRGGSGRGSGGQNAGVVGEFAAVGQFDALGGRVQAPGGCSEAQFQIGVSRVLGGEKPETADVPFPGKELLGQR